MSNFNIPNLNKPKFALPVIFIALLSSCSDPFKDSVINFGNQYLSARISSYENSKVLRAGSTTYAQVSITDTESITSPTFQDTETFRSELDIKAEQDNYNAGIPEIKNIEYSAPGKPKRITAYLSIATLPRCDTPTNNYSGLLRLKVTRTKFFSRGGGTSTILEQHAFDNAAVLGNNNTTYWSYDNLTLASECNNINWPVSKSYDPELVIFPQEPCINYNRLTMEGNLLITSTRYRLLSYDSQTEIKSKLTDILTAKRYNPDGRFNNVLKSVCVANDSGIQIIYNNSTAPKAVIIGTVIESETNTIKGSAYGIADYDSLPKELKEKATLTIR
jgi:hypothetical protein